MSQYVVARRKSHPVRNVLLVLLVVVLVYLGCAGLSLYRIYESGQRAQSAYSGVQQAISSGNLSDALDDTRTLCAAAGEVGDEADSWVWVVGEHIPWIGEDVAVGRGLAHVSDSLCNDALLPVVESYEGVTSGTGTVSDAASTLQSAATTISSCDQTLQGLGTSHFSQLNDAKSELSQATSQLDGAVGSVSGLVGTLGSLASLAG